jgi:hypothetical protein
MPKHTHKAIDSKSELYGWVRCVNPSRCQGESSAHGGVMYIDHCRCGALRKTEINGRAKCFGLWYEPEPTRQ